MAYAFPHVLLRFNGHFGASGVSVVDRWSTGIRLGLPNAGPEYDPAKLQTLVNAAQTAANTFHTAAQVTTGTNCYLDQVSGAQIGQSGLYSPAGQLTVLSPSTPTAGVGTPVMPWNAASVMSLRTSIPRGRGSNGRVYWPAIAAPIDAVTGRISSTPQQARTTAFATFLNALNTAAGTYFPGTKVIVASNIGLGVSATVTSVRMDNRLDSIERRENDLTAQWTTAPVT